MKYYETSYDEHIRSVNMNNMHPELKQLYCNLPKNKTHLTNMCFYGPSGVGKYSQVLFMLKKYSPTELKYDKKLTVTTDKSKYVCRISDIHYEVDMSLLGCNSKQLWHEIFYQIVDIVSLKTDKIGIIMCKNFHTINSELLDVFYSYMQEYNHQSSVTKIKFLLVSEQVSFLPDSILNVCYMVRVQRPSRDKYVELLNQNDFKVRNNGEYINQIPEHNLIRTAMLENTTNNLPKETNFKILEDINTPNILNLKEMRSFPLLINSDEIPNDIFNSICDNIITEIEHIEEIDYMNFREKLYDILTYNLDIGECVWYIISYFTTKGSFQEKDVNNVLQKTYQFLKYYNNNYRPIYHLENIMLYIAEKANNENEL